MMRALVLAAALLLPAANSCPAEPTPKPTHCAEDDPCWNCHTMGNKHCTKGEHRT